jgi:hypothetical protein
MGLGDLQGPVLSDDRHEPMMAVRWCSSCRKTTNHEINDGWATCDECLTKVCMHPELDALGHACVECRNPSAQIQAQENEALILCEGEPRDVVLTSGYLVTADKIERWLEGSA